jgi:hypothetical protein
VPLLPPIRSARRLGHCIATRHSFCHYSPPLEENEAVSPPAAALKRLPAKAIRI